MNQHRLEQNWFDVILEFDFNFGKLFNEIPSLIQHTHIVERDLANLFELVNQSFRLELCDRFKTFERGNLSDPSKNFWITQSIQDSGVAWNVRLKISPSGQLQIRLEHSDRPTTVP